MPPPRPGAIATSAAVLDEPSDRLRLHERQVGHDHEHGPFEGREQGVERAREPPGGNADLGFGRLEGVGAEEQGLEPGPAHGGDDVGEHGPGEGLALPAGEKVREARLRVDGPERNHGDGHGAIVSGMRSDKKRVRSAEV